MTTMTANTNNRRSTAAHIPIVYASVHPLSSSRSSGSAHLADNDVYFVKAEAIPFQELPPPRQLLNRQDDHPIVVSASNVQPVLKRSKSIPRRDAPPPADPDQGIVVSVDRHPRPAASVYHRPPPAVRAKKVLPPPIQQFKNKRQRRQTAALITGGVVGGVLLGPFGGVAVAVVAHGITKRVGRAKQAKLERILLTQQPQMEAAQ